MKEGLYLLKQTFMLHLKNSCRSFGVPAKLDVPQKDAVVKSMEFCVQQLARNAKVMNVKIDSILIQVMIIQCFRTLSITLYCHELHILFCIAISINLIKLSKLEITFTILQKFCTFCK